MRPRAFHKNAKKNLALHDHHLATPDFGLASPARLALAVQAAGPARQVKLNAQLLRKLGFVDDSGCLTQLRSITLVEPVLVLALLRNIKTHDMRKRKFPAGPYWVHAGASNRGQDCKVVLDQEWQDHPQYGSNP